MHTANYNEISIKQNKKIQQVQLQRIKISPL